MHLGPPGVVGVIDDEEDLTPQQHQGRVGGDQALHHVVEPLQGVKQVGLCSSRANSTFTLEKAAGSHSYPPEHSCKDEGSQE